LQKLQEDDFAVRKFEGVVIVPLVLLIDPPKDRLEAATALRQTWKKLKARYIAEGRARQKEEGVCQFSVRSANCRPGEALAHIPGDDGWPIVGHTLAILADPKGFVERRAQRYGPVNRSRVIGRLNVTLLGPEANELVLLDPQKLFSSALGWGFILDLLFPRGLMLLDFEEHRLHRRALSAAFKSGPMQSYLTGLNAGIAKGLSQWPRGREFEFYPAIKRLTLDLAATSFLGEELDPELEAVQRAFIAMVAGSIGIIRTPLPGSRLGQGVKGRAFIVDYFNRQIPLRRETVGEDLFSLLCRATWDDGTLLSNADIVNHMAFFMMAAHDTLTSSLTSFVYRG
jgi:cytochrome P450